MKAPQMSWQLQVALLALGVVGVVAWKVGSIKKAGEIVASSVVAAGSGVIVGTVSGVSETLGIPAPSQTFDDPKVGRWVIDNRGYFAASKWFDAVTFFKALALPEGSGTAPPFGSVLYTV